MLSATGLTKSLGGKTILHDVAIPVNPGEITVLIGPSGSGKTTLLRALSLLDPPDSGTVAIDDAVYTFPLEEGQSIKPPWPHVTVVFQQFFLWPHLTLRRNITLPIEDKYKGRKKVLEGRVRELIEMFDMEQFIDRYPNETSLGQRQRAAIARALILDPSYVLLDEITSALDVEQIHAILKMLQMLRDKGIGILLVTHLIDFARKAANHVVFLDNGRVLEAGGRDVLMSPQCERLRRLLSVIESAR